MTDTFITKENFLVVLDSRNATRYFNGSWNSSISFNLQDAISKNDDCDISLSFSLLNFSCPNSIYNINETNNKFNIEIEDVYNVELKNGNYDFNSLRDTLLSLLPTLKMSLDSITNKILFYTDNINFIIHPSTLLSIIGGDNETTYYSNNFKLMMPFVCNFNGVNNINIYVSNISTRNMDSYRKSNCSLLQSIMIKPYEPFINYIKSSDYNILIGQDNIITRLQIDIYDDINNLINLNNQHWNLTLCFTIIKQIPIIIGDNLHSILQNAYN